MPQKNCGAVPAFCCGDPEGWVVGGSSFTNARMFFRRRIWWHQRVRRHQVSSQVRVVLMRPDGSVMAGGRLTAPSKVPRSSCLSSAGGRPLP